MAKKSTATEPLASVGDIMAKVQEEQGRKLKGELEEAIGDLLERVKYTKVVDAGSYQQADLDCKMLKERRDLVEAKLSPFIEAANKLHKFFCGVRASIFLQIDPHVDRLRREMGGWKRAEEQKVRDEEARLSREEQEREKRRLEDEAALRRDQGDELGAQVAEQQAAQAPAPAIVLHSTVPALEGTSYTTYYRWRPIGGDTPENRKRLVMTIIPRDHLKIDDVDMNAFAERMKGTAKVPGIEFYSEELPTQRRRSA